MTVFAGAFSEIPLLRYSTIMADPPWSFSHYSAKGHGKSAQNHYACMTLDDIKALPVADIAGPDAFLHLWATRPMLPEALEVLRAWHFTYKSLREWGKTTESGGLAFGTGYLYRDCSEILLTGTIGRPRSACRSIRSLFLAPRREHSRKPDVAFEDAARMDPDGRRIELFSREPRTGWDSWGNEAEKFAGAAA